MMSYSYSKTGIFDELKRIENIVLFLYLCGICYMFIISYGVFVVLCSVCLLHDMCFVFSPETVMSRRIMKVRGV